MTPNMRVYLWQCLLAMQMGATDEIEKKKKQKSTMSVHYGLNRLLLSFNFATLFLQFILRIMSLTDLQVI